MKVPFLKQAILVATLVVFLGSLYAQKTIQHKRSASTYSNGSTYINVEGDMSSTSNESTITYRNGGEKYNLKMVGDKITELYINDKKIPADSIYLYKATIDKIKEQLKKDRAQAEADRQQAAKDRAQAELDRVQAGKDRQQAIKDQQQAELDRAQAVKDRAQADRDREESIKQQEQAKAYRQQAEKDRQQAEEDRQQAEEDRQQAMKDQAQAILDRKQAELDRKQAEKDRQQAEEDRALIKSILTEVVKNQLAPDEESVTSLVLNSDEFSINGKKQSEELHAAFKAKFLKKPGYTIRYENNKGYGVYIRKNTP